MNFPIIFETSEIHLNYERKRSFSDLLSVESKNALKGLFKEKSTRENERVRWLSNIDSLKFEYI